MMSKEKVSTVVIDNSAQVNAVVKSKDKYYFQYIVAFSACLICITSGELFGWTSPSLPILLSPDSSIPINNDQSSWIVTLFFIGQIITPIPSAWVMDRYGRKTILLLAVLPGLLGWLLIGVAENVATLYVSRIVSGICCGASYYPIAIYLGEISSDRIRGSVTAMLNAFGKVGILYVYAIGPYVSIKTMTWLGLIPPCLFVLTFVWMPESPYFLLGNGKVEDTYKCLVKLRRHNNVQVELEKMAENIRLSKKNKSTYRELFKAGNRRSLIIILGLGALQVLSGSQAILSYSNLLFKNVGADFLKPSELAIMFAVVQLIATTISVGVVDWIGRRPLLLLSVFGVTICNAIVGIYFLLIRLDYDVSGIAWLPVTAIMIFIITFCLGLSAIPFAVLGEIFPKHLKALAAAAFGTSNSVFQILVSKLFQIVSDDLGSDVTFLGFAVICFVFIPFVWFLVPETKRKSLDDILVQMRETKINT